MTTPVHEEPERRTTWRERGFRPVFLWLALLWEIGIYVASSVSGAVGAPSLLRVFVANATHAGIYAVLAFLIAMGLPKERRWAWVAFGVAVLLGATDELHQSFVPNRTPSMLDWTTDLFGALFGVLLRLRLLAARAEFGTLYWLLGLSVFFAANSALAATLL